MMLTARDLVAGFPGREPVLSGASITLPDGGRVALLGANGCGKTTLLRCLSGAHRPERGEVARDGVRLEHGRRGLREHRSAVQLVLQDAADQLFSADVTQDVSFGPMNLGLPVAEVRARVDDTLAMLGIEHLAERATHQLSYGEQKKVALAGAVAMAPSVLLLDEPTAGLDPEGVAEMTAILDRLHSDGTSLLVATHDVDWALAWADAAAIVVDGTVRQGPVAEMLDDQALLASARLTPPWTLRLAPRLGLRGRPRTLDEMAALIEARLSENRTTA